MIREFTCTAMRRPGIFRDTLASFAANLRGVDFSRCGLFVNIDPAPEAGDGAAVVAAAREVFGSVYVHEPPTCNFAAAVKWCWPQPAGEFFFHLEDDWLIEKPVEIADMFRVLDDPAVSVVNLRAYDHNDDRLCLAPGLWRTSHAREIAGRLRDDANPERQLQPARPNNPHGGKHNGFVGRQFPKERVLLDIGRPWMRACGLRRAGGRDFIQWAM